jgi:hypothetical protein
MTGWRDLVRDAAVAKSHDTRKRSRGASDTAHISRVGFAVAAHKFLVLAARRRGISISGYIRRATLAVVAMDLGLKAIDLFEFDSGITPIGRVGSKPTKDLDGKLYGRWEVQPGEYHPGDAGEASER